MQRELVFFLAALAPALALPAPGEMGGLRGGPPHGKAVVCYVSTWAEYREGRGKFSVEHVDPSLCTHLVYAFAGLNSTSSTIRSLDPYLDLTDDYGKGSYQKMTSLKTQFPHLKVSLAIGGWVEGSANYSALASDPEKRKIFTKSVLEFLRKFDFDGLDLDWEFPTKRGGVPEDRENFSLLIKELKAELGREGYILTAALSAGIETLESGYILPDVYQYLDFIHLMCYDYHGNWEAVTGANAPLSSTLTGDLLTVEQSVEYLLSHGVKGDKVVLGLPMYGRTFVLEKTESEGMLGEPSAKDQGFKGPFTLTEGFLGFNEICNELKTGNWTEHWDNASYTPFATSGNKVISYDNAESIREKVLFSLRKELAGVMVWSIDTDDFRGDCLSAKNRYPRYPLLHTINEALAEEKEEEKVKSTPKKTISPNSAPTTSVSLPVTLSLVFSLLFTFPFLL